MEPGQSKTGHLDQMLVERSGGTVHYRSQSHCSMYSTAMGHGCDIDVTGQRAAEVHVPYDRDGGDTLCTWERMGLHTNVKQRYILQDQKLCISK